MIVKVSELLKILQSADQNDLVVISQDEEGNGFRPLGFVDMENMVYADGETGYKVLTPELEEQGYAEEDVLEYGEDCVVLW